ncbi:GNAT family N-acetyltransferase [soil metagenome]
MAICNGVVHLRRAREDDAHGMAEVHVRTWQHAYRDLLPPEVLRGLRVDARERWWATEIHTVPLNRRPWIAETNTDIGGFVSVGPSRDALASPNTGEIYALYVAPECWDHGVGRNLLAHGQKDLAEHGYSEATLWVLADNVRARAFYEAAGWQTDGTERTERIADHEIREVRYRRSLDSSRFS